MSGSSLFVGGGYNNWWPTDLGAAGSTGAQNNLRYAYFPAIRRLAIDINGQVSVYETRRPPDRRLLAAAKRRSVPDVHKPVRPGTCG